MMRLYHPQYEAKRDRVTGVAFTATRHPDGRIVAAADVPAHHVASLRERGWLPWPGALDKPQPLPDDLDALTIAQIRQLASERDVELGPRGTKAELIAALQAAVA